MPMDIKAWLRTARALASASQQTDAADNQQSVRAGRYNEPFSINLLPDEYALADEGSYFVATNPAPGTGIAFAVTTALSDTAGVAVMIQNADAAGGKRLYLDYLKLLVTVAPASGTAAHYAMKLDSGVSRYTSGGSTITPVNPNLDSGQATISRFYAGALTTVAASSAARLIARGQLRTVIPVVGDQFFFKFGGSERSPGGAVLNGTNPQIYTVPCPPVVLSPGTIPGSFALNLWFPSNATTPLSFEFEAGWWER